jgi:2-polyprenyl-3-methyl-5-hydroxy-6-metoxy-1,4-benzoquinol methylase
MKKKKKNRRDELLSLIPASINRALDVGCGLGNIWERFKRGGIEVAGIERDQSLCSGAREILDKVFCVDAEKFQLPYPEGYFDCILCADVLEHLVEPLKFLKKYKSYLNDSGFIVASIPNIRYYKVIIRLVFAGTWDYADKGIMDKTHMRFFTLTNIKELFSEAGYDIVDIKRNIVASRWIKVLNFVLFGSLKDFISYQYYIKAGKASKDNLSFIRRRKVHQF